MTHLTLVNDSRQVKFYVWRVTTTLFFCLLVIGNREVLARSPKEEEDRLYSIPEVMNTRDKERLSFRQVRAKHML